MPRNDACALFHEALKSVLIKHPMQPQTLRKLVIAHAHRIDVSKLAGQGRQ